MPRTTANGATKSDTVLHRAGLTVVAVEDELYDALVAQIDGWRFTHGF